MIKNQKHGFTPLEVFKRNKMLYKIKIKPQVNSFIKYALPKSSVELLTGFTLIEVIMVIAIFAIVMGALMNFIIIIYRSQSYSLEQAVAVNEARRGIETMVKEIREARTAENGSYIIEKAEDNEFIFYSDIDNDDSVERVRYFLGPTARIGVMIDDCVAFVDGGLFHLPALSQARNPSGPGRKMVDPAHDGSHLRNVFRTYGRGDGPKGLAVFSADRNALCLHFHLQPDGGDSGPGAADRQH